MKREEVMKGRRMANGDHNVKNVSFAEGLRQVAMSGGMAGKLTDREKAKFERARLAEEESKRSSFTLGIQLD